MPIFQYDLDGLLEEFKGRSSFGLGRGWIEKKGGALLLVGPGFPAQEICPGRARDIVNLAMRVWDAEYRGGGQTPRPVEPSPCGWADDQDFQDAWAEWENHLRQQAEMEEDLLYKVEDQMMGY